ncbi:uncharacterized protein [Nicotiana tomentosiformis]|uniref:uncharacterized protein n=1 Tax=Nicotiana tomentosiformis TaxID=4098 RepID=UPI00388CB0DB
MLWACVIDFKGSWDDHLPLIEFAYNNSYHSSIQMAPYEALYERKCRSSIGWFDDGKIKLVGLELVQQAIEKINLIQERLLATQSRQSWSFKLMTGIPNGISDKRHYKVRVVSVDDVQVTEQLSYEENPIAILDRQVRRLRTKDVASVKVLWRNNNVEEMTWEA